MITIEISYTLYVLLVASLIPLNFMSGLMRAREEADKWKWQTSNPVAPLSWVDKWFFLATAVFLILFLSTHELFDMNLNHNIFMLVFMRTYDFTLDLILMSLYYFILGYLSGVIVLALIGQMQSFKKKGLKL